MLKSILKKFKLRRIGIGLKITLCIVIVLMIAMGSLSTVSFAYMSKIMQSSIISSLQNTASNQAKLLSQQVKAYETTVASIALIPDLESSGLNMLSKIAKTNGYISIGIASNDGMTHYSDGTTSGISKSSYFKTAVSGKATISDPVTSSGKSVVYVTAPIKNNSGKVLGVVIAKISASFLSSFSSSGNADGSVIVNSSSKQIASQNHGNGKNAPKNGDKNGGPKNGGSSAPQSDKPNSNASSGKNKADPMKAISSGKTGIIAMNFNNTLNYIAYTPIPGTNWYIGVMSKPSNLFSSINAMISVIFILCIIFILAAIIICTLLIRLLVTKPLKKTVHMIEELSLGHLGGRLRVKSNDEIGKMSSSMNKLADSLNMDVVGIMNNIANGDLSDNIIPRDEKDEITPVLKNTILTIRSITEETQNIIRSAENGDLQKRCDIQSYKGSWKLLAEEINGLMDCVSQPIGEVSAVINKMSQNDFTAKVEGNYKGIFNNLVKQVDTVQVRFLDVQDLMSEISCGDMHRLSEFKEKQRLSQNDNLTPAVTIMMQSIEDLISEVQRLTGEAAKGNVLKVRGNAGKFEGDYKKIIEGFNDTLDAISKPISELSNILETMSLNDYTSVIKSECKGDFKLIENAVSSVQQSLISVQNTAVRIARGDISELERYRSEGKKSENDKLVPALIKMMESIQDLIEETTKIANEAANGNLRVRGDDEKFEGGYAEVVNSINELLAAVERPLDSIKDVMTSLSNCSLDQKIEGEYNGDFKVLIDAVNAMAAILRDIVSELSHKMIKMAKGDFNIDSLDKFSGDFEPMSDALNAILATLNNLIGSIGITSDEVFTGASQVSQGSKMLSEGATEQASALDGLASTINEISVQTRQNAINANEANNLAEQVKENASAGSGQMDNMLASMMDISNASNDILKIINVIDDIAFQTNILSLNAAVEAARAGNNGKGFAVVAEEVRNLASRSAEAAKNTAGLIEGTISKVRAGTEMADNVAKSFKSIADGVNEVSNRVGEIALASNEQATGIASIDNGLQQISKVVQTNSASAEESAAASEELTEQARKLKNDFTNFRLREE